MRTRSLLGWAITGSVGVALFAADASVKPEPAENLLMQAKLENTQLIVKGLVQKDFRRINDAAAEILKTCEGQDWQCHDDETYQAYRDQLTRQSRKLIDQAGVRNLEGATYAYLGVLSTCVDCHSHCRDVLMIATDAPALSPIPTAADSKGTVTP